MRTILLQTFVVSVAFGMVACGGSDTTTPPGGAVGGSNQTGGTGPLQTTRTGGTTNGTTAEATGGTQGNPATGGVATGGKQATGGAATGGAATGGAATGGAATGGKATGGAATGGSNATGGSATGGGSKATGGSAAAGGSKATGGATAAGGSNATGGSAAAGAATGGGTSTGPDCSATMPTGGVDHTGTNVNGTADGLGYGIWTNGSGGTITVFNNAHAFAASWNNSQDFLAHLGLDFNPPKATTAFTSIVAQYVEIKSGTAGGFSMIGMYGWMHSPCIEWYINEDSWGNLGGGGTATATIDGGTYSLKSVTTTGTGGANACEAGHTGSWTQLISTRSAKRTCGTVTVTDHFKAWAAQGWSLGTLTSVHINVEVGGGVGSIQFPVANVTAN